VRYGFALRVGESVEEMVHGNGVVWGGVPANAVGTSYSSYYAERIVLSFVVPPLGGETPGIPPKGGTTNGLCKLRVYYANHATQDWENCYTVVEIVLEPISQ
jgi:hypothetical protein